MHVKDILMKMCALAKVYNFTDLIKITNEYRSKKSDSKMADALHTATVNFCFKNLARFYLNMEVGQL